MHEEPSLNGASRDEYIQYLVLALLLDPSSHGPWTAAEIGRELGSNSDAADAVAGLNAAGLVHLCHELVFPTRPAAACLRLTGAA
jgi:hypothetical protein